MREGAQQAILSFGSFLYAYVKNPLAYIGGAPNPVLGQKTMVQLQIVVFDLSIKVRFWEPSEIRQQNDDVKEHHGVNTST